jgi:predicted DsbA family dithiol-disulfide isomerase
VKEVKRRVPDLKIVWRAFELRPEPVPTLDPRGEYLQRAWSQSVYPLANRLGMMMRMPPVQPRSRLAHEAAAWARSQGRFEPTNEAIFRAFFERGEDIGQVGVLASLAISIGLDGEELKRSLQRHDHLREVLADEQQADRYGLRGVPAFVAGGTVLFGVQSADTLEEFVHLADQAAAAPPAEGILPHLPMRLKK